MSADELEKTEEHSVEPVDEWPQPEGAAEEAAPELGAEELAAEAEVAADEEAEVAEEAEAAAEAEKVAPVRPPTAAQARRLTIKQAKWLKLYMQLGNATEAAARVYKCSARATAASIGSANLRTLREDIMPLMEAAGLTLPFLAGKLKEGCEATSVHYAQLEGTITDSKEEPDFDARHRFASTALKLLGMFKEKVELSTAETAPLTIVLRKMAPITPPAAEPAEDPAEEKQE